MSEPVDTKQQVRAFLNCITPGPWSSNMWGEVTRYTKDGEKAIVATGCGIVDGSYIAKSREWFGILLAEIDRLEAEVERLTDRGPSVPAVTFMELYRRGEVEEEEILDFTDFWHTEYDGNLGLYEYLGFTRDQGKRWVETGRLPERDEC
ncbi:hypothetical protein BJD55_gp098 [Gordonia phage Yvonnetastic]|uniref:Uncharacterized protein n=1 Tax=Gordonia phage Yvonnetastic TaxID=1821566 RepID=A0A142K985_9CAUD|nr:hypothetical protein BJD55_gp098 [Gordonia phage Yvonnetastic]AMS02668.1 hypothetical protein SEA_YVONNETASTIC_124 [Gordonia phage Yvonnetastic]